MLTLLAPWVEIVQCRYDEDSRKPKDSQALTSPYVQDDGLASNLRLAVQRAEELVSAETFADELGLERGVSGFVNHTVPVAIFCWLRHRHDFRAALEAVICLGGDTDTGGAIVGGLIGSRLPDVTWPKEWELDGTHFKQLAVQLAESSSSRIPAVPKYRFWPLTLIRNVFFATIVLFHGFRRLLPPY